MNTSKALIPISLLAVVAVAGVGWLAREAFFGSDSGDGGIAGAASEFAYRKDWLAAVDEARQSGKPLLLNFGGPW